METIESIASLASLELQTRWARNRVLRAESELKESIEDLEKLEKMLELEIEKYNNAHLSQDEQSVSWVSYVHSSFPR